MLQVHAILLGMLIILSCQIQPNTACENGGILVDGSCKCPPSYTGDNCETQKSKFVCLNGGFLFDKEKQICVCISKFFGKQCHEDSQMQSAVVTPPISNTTAATEVPQGEVINTPITTAESEIPTTTAATEVSITTPTTTTAATDVHISTPTTTTAATEVPITTPTTTTAATEVPITTPTTTNATTDVPITTPTTTTAATDVPISTPTTTTAATEVPITTPTTTTAATEVPITTPTTTNATTDVPITTPTTTTAATDVPITTPTTTTATTDVPITTPTTTNATTDVPITTSNTTIAATEAPQVEVNATCHSNMTLYADGNLVATHHDGTTAKYLSIPAATKVVGIACTVDRDKTSTYGILASFKLEIDGDYITDATWKCSTTYVAGWSSGAYRDDPKDYAAVLGDNIYPPSGYTSVDDITPHANWIWSDNHASQTGIVTVYCHGNLIGETRLDSFGRKFVIGFTENSPINGTIASLCLHITTDRTTTVTVLVTTPIIDETSAKYVNEVYTVQHGEVVEVILPLALKHTEKLNGTENILVIATDSVKIFGINYASQSTDTFLNFPVDALGAESDGSEYYVVCWDASDYGFGSRILIIAAYDGTEIDITPTDAIKVDGIQRSKDITFKVTLNQYFSLLLSANKRSITGTHLVSNKPIIVYSGNKKSEVVPAGSVNGTAVGYMIEQLMPVSTWGRRFFLTPLPYKESAHEPYASYRNSAQLEWYKILAAKNNTNVNITLSNGQSNQSITEKVLLQQGQSYKYHLLRGYVAVIKSSNVIMVAQFSTSRLPDECLGDPWLLIIPPVYLYDREYTIRTPMIPNGSCGSNDISSLHFITVIVKDEYKDGIRIDGVRIGNVTEVQVLGYKPIVKTKYVYQTVEILQGSYVIDHEDNSVSFGVLQFGYGFFDAYATIAGTKMAHINEICTVTTSTFGDGIDNDCDDEIDEDTCDVLDISKDCAPNYSPISSDTTTEALTSQATDLTSEVLSASTAGATTAGSTETTYGPVTTENIVTTSYTDSTTPQELSTDKTTPIQDINAFVTTDFTTVKFDTSTQLFSSEIIVTTTENYVTQTVTEHDTFTSSGTYTGGNNELTSTSSQEIITSDTKTSKSYITTEKIPASTLSDAATKLQTEITTETTVLQSETTKPVTSVQTSFLPTSATATTIQSPETPIATKASATTSDTIQTTEAHTTSLTTSIDTTTEFKTTPGTTIPITEANEKTSVFNTMPKTTALEITTKLTSISQTSTASETTATTSFESETTMFTTDAQPATTIASSTQVITEQTTFPYPTTVVTTNSPISPISKTTTSTESETTMFTTDAQPATTIASSTQVITEQTTFPYPTTVVTTNSPISPISKTTTSTESETTMFTTDAQPATTIASSTQVITEQTTFPYPTTVVTTNFPISPISKTTAKEATTHTITEQTTDTILTTAPTTNHPTSTMPVTRGKAITQGVTEHTTDSQLTTLHTTNAPTSNRPVTMAEESTTQAIIKQTTDPIITSSPATNYPTSTMPVTTEKIITTQANNEETTESQLTILRSTSNRPVTTLLESSTPVKTTDKLNEVSTAAIIITSDPLSTTNTDISTAKVNELTTLLQTPDSITSSVTSRVTSNKPSTLSPFTTNEITTSTFGNAVTTSYPETCGKDGMVECTCMNSLYGRNCSISLKSTNCSQAPCQNGGSCTETRTGKPVCTCPTQTAGRMCELVCTGEEFACENECIPKSWHCDGNRDCFSGKDELNCPLCSSLDKKISCGPVGASKSQCALLSCCYDDSVQQCFHAQNSACYNLGCLNNGVCEGTFTSAVCVCSEPWYGFRCDKECIEPNYWCGTQCFPPHWRCDGTKDCSYDGGRDEANCTAQTCPSNLFQCDGYKCIPLTSVCDDVTNCKDGTDERNCTNSTCSCSSFSSVGCVPDSNRCVCNLGYGGSTCELYQCGPQSRLQVFNYDADVLTGALNSQYCSIFGQTYALTEDQCALSSCSHNGTIVQGSSATSLYIYNKNKFACTQYICNGWDLGSSSVQNGDVKLVVFIPGGTNPCSSNPCGDGNTCGVSSLPSPVVSSYPNLKYDYTCKCSDGSTNVKLCTPQSNNECGSSPCQNGGVCVEEPPGDYTCTCRTGFDGKNCEQNGYPYMYKMSMTLLGTYTTKLASQSSTEYKDLVLLLKSLLSSNFGPVELPHFSSFSFFPGSTRAEIEFSLPVATDSQTLSTRFIDSLAGSSITLQNNSISITILEAIIFQCDFEKPVGDCYRDGTSNKGNFTWTQSAAPTPSFGTGPSYALQGEKFLFLESSAPQITGDKAIFELAVFKAIGTGCLKFSYSMYGSNIGYLEVYMVYVKTDGTFERKVIYNVGGYSLPSGIWKTANVFVDLGNGQPSFVQFVGTIGTGSEGDIAVDDVTLSLLPFQCNSGCTKSSKDPSVTCCENTLGPHHELCVNEYWTKYCFLQGLAYPLVSSAWSEYYNAMALISIQHSANDMFNKAQNGDIEATKSCYGNFSNNIRLKDGDKDSTNEGRVEILLNYDWYTVCENNLGNNVAAVFCRQLGHLGGEVRTGAYYGAGNVTYPIFIANFNCNGTEKYLAQCSIERRSFATCTHEEDFGIHCFQDITEPVSVIGESPTTWDSTTFSKRDKTFSAAFIPGVVNFIQKAGAVIQWSSYFDVPVKDFYFQVWRLSGQEMFTLVGQTHIQDAPNGEFTVNLTASQEIVVAEKDYLGFYFPTNNPLRWKSQECYESNQQLRYISDPEITTSSIGQTFKFIVAPLAWDPCRLYFYGASIRNNIGPTTTATPTTTPSAPTIPPGAVVFCSFENGLQCEKGGKAVILPSIVPSGINETHTWRVISGPTPSYGTGPDDAIRGAKYIYAEASESVPGEQYVMATPDFQVTGNSFCLSFIYHMLGTGVGSLKVTIEPISSGTSPTSEINNNRLFYIQGSQSTQWKTVLRKVQDFKLSHAKIVFTAIIGDNYQGDIALDNIVITQDICPDREIIPPLPMRMETVPTNSSILGMGSENFLASVPNLLETIYVSPTGSQTNCTFENPCSNFSTALQRLSSNKTVLFICDKSCVVKLKLGNIQELTKSLNLINNNSDVNVTLEVQSTTDPLCFENLEIRNVIITGTFMLDCKFRVITNVILKHVTHHNANIRLWNTNNLKVIAQNCYYFNSFFSYLTKVDSLVNFDTCTFEASRQVSGNRHVRSTLVQRLFNYTGLHAHFPEQDGRHSLVITNSSFSGLYQHAGTMSPIGGVTVLSEKKNSILKIKIEDSSFQFNERAIDLSVKGHTDVKIIRSQFNYNFANGSGGAFRITGTNTGGLDASNSVKKLKLDISESKFEHNIAERSSMYNVSRDLYYQSRSPGSGGAVYVFVAVPSQLPKDGLVSIVNSHFHNNTGDIQGGTIFINPKISTIIQSCNLSNTQLSTRPKFGDAIYASCNMTMRDTTIFIKSTDGTTPVLSYQASDASNYRLLIENVTLSCPMGHWIEQLNTSSFAQTSSLETLQVYCRGCQNNEYSLNISSSWFDGNSAHITNQIVCTSCPYGAQCDKGILNMNDFWGNINYGWAKQGEGTVALYPCPQEYCVQNNNSKVFYDSCAENREGTLCGQCKSGYSESLFGTLCIPNEQCGWHNWWVALLLGLYGFFYVLFFMFEHDWERFVKWISSKIQRKKNELAEEDENIVDNADMSQSGYFQIFMYFIQTSALLKVKIVLQEDDVYKGLYRPQDILPNFLVDGIKQVFSFDLAFLQENTCLLQNLNMVSKTEIKLLFVAYCFVILLMLYFASGLCCIFRAPDARPKIGPLSNTARLLITVLSLFLYTYQSVAEDSLLLLNCVNVGDKRVLFYNGTVTCLQEWQYYVIALVVIFVIPFFVVLLFGPKLMYRKDIGVIYFFTACAFPLFLSVPMILYYFGIIKCKKKSDSELEINKEDSDEENENYCCGNVDHIRLEIVDALSGPYRDDIFNGICYEGILNFRRMVMVVLFTFITDVLLKQMALALTGFIILAIHIKAKPFKQQFSNYIETLALSLLLVLSGINLVKAAFHHSQIIPRGPSYLTMIIYEWIEAICVGLLPLTIILLIIVSMVFKTGSKFLKNKISDKEEDNASRRSSVFTDIHQNYNGARFNYSQLYRQYSKEKTATDPKFHKSKQRPKHFEIRWTPAYRDYVNDYLTTRRPSSSNYTQSGSRERYRSSRSSSINSHRRRLSSSDYTSSGSRERYRSSLSSSIISHGRKLSSDNPSLGSREMHRSSPTTSSNDSHGKRLSSSDYTHGSRERHRSSQSSSFYSHLSDWSFIPRLEKVPES